MEVILLEKVHNLGSLGDKVRVKSGFGRNYLLPKGMAVPATPDNVAKFEARRAELEAVAAAKLAEAQQRLEQFEGKVLIIAQKAGEEGRLFGSVGTSDIAEAAEAAGIKIEKREVRLPEGPIRNLGEYDIELDLHSDLVATIKVNIVAE